VSSQLSFDSNQSDEHKNKKTDGVENLIRDWMNKTLSSFYSGSSSGEWSSGAAPSADAVIALAPHQRSGDMLACFTESC
jgi:hypothetical protein